MVSKRASYVTQVEKAERKRVIEIDIIILEVDLEKNYGNYS